MLSRSLSGRLNRLEARFGPASEPIHYVIRFVDSNGKVTSTLTFENGQQKWWYAPGHEPLDSSAESKPMGQGKNVQMIPGDPR